MNTVPARRLGLVEGRIGRLEEVCYGASAGRLCRGNADAGRDNLIRASLMNDGPCHNGLADGFRD